MFALVAGPPFPDANPAEPVPAKVVMACDQAWEVTIPRANNKAGLLEQIIVFKCIKRPRGFGTDFRQRGIITLVITQSGTWNRHTLPKELMAV
jgi:hypothetical protein